MQINLLKEEQNNHMEKEKPKSFRLSPINFKTMTKKDYGRNFAIGILSGYVLNIDKIPVIGAIGDILALSGVICGFIWLYKTIKEKCYAK